jgi:hypothetical protein
LDFQQGRHAIEHLGDFGIVNAHRCYQATSITLPNDSRDDARERLAHDARQRFEPEYMILLEVRDGRPCLAGIAAGGGLDIAPARER